MRPALRVLAVLVFFGACLYALTAENMFLQLGRKILPKEYLQASTPKNEMEWESGFGMMITQNLVNFHFHDQSQ
jgi:hypothetical protein